MLGTAFAAQLELPVYKAVSTFGKRGVAMVAIAYYRASNAEKPNPT
jgi:hypothetical protein